VSWLEEEKPWPGGEEKPWGGGEEKPWRGSWSGSELFSSDAELEAELGSSKSCETEADTSMPSWGAFPWSRVAFLGTLDALALASGRMFL
jgi:hypothetical protein